MTWSSTVTLRSLSSVVFAARDTPDVLSNLCFSVLSYQLAPFVHSLFL